MRASGGVSSRGGATELGGSTCGARQARDLCFGWDQPDSDSAGPEIRGKNHTRGAFAMRRSRRRRSTIRGIGRPTTSTGLQLRRPAPAHTDIRKACARASIHWGHGRATGPIDRKLRTRSDFEEHRAETGKAKLARIANQLRRQFSTSDGASRWPRVCEHACGTPHRFATRVSAFERSHWSELGHLNAV